MKTIIEMVKVDGTRIKTTVRCPINLAQVFRTHNDVLAIRVHIPGDDECGPTCLQFDRNQFKVDALADKPEPRDADFGHDGSRATDPRFPKY